jgi:hypothetical protein
MITVMEAAKGMPYRLFAGYTFNSTQAEGRHHSSTQLYARQAGLVFWCTHAVSLVATVRLGTCT